MLSLLMAIDVLEAVSWLASCRSLLSDLRLLFGGLLDTAKCLALLGELIHCQELEENYAPQFSANVVFRAKLAKCLSDCYIPSIAWGSRMKRLFSKFKKNIVFSLS
jgi:hypothetical protein